MAMTGRKWLILSWLFGVLAPAVLFRGDSILFTSYEAVEPIGIFSEDWRLPLCWGVALCVTILALFLIGARWSRFVRWLVAPVLLFGAVLATFIASRLLIVGIIPLATTCVFAGWWYWTLSKTRWPKVLFIHSVVFAAVMGAVTIGWQEYGAFRRDIRLEKVETFPARDEWVVRAIAESREGLRAGVVHGDAPREDREFGFLSKCHTAENVAVREYEKGIVAVSGGTSEALWRRGGSGNLCTVVDRDRVVILDDCVEVRDALTGRVLSSASFKMPTGDEFGKAALYVLGDRLLLVRPWDISDGFPVCLIEVRYDGRTTVLKRLTRFAAVATGPDGARYVLDVPEQDGPVVVSRLSDEQATLWAFLGR